MGIKINKFVFIDSYLCYIELIRGFYQLSHLGTFQDHIERFNHITLNAANNPQPSESSIKESILDKIDWARFENVQNRRISPDPIIKVRATKQKENKILTLHIVRQGVKGS